VSALHLPRRTISILLALAALIAMAPDPARAAGKTHRLALQVSDNDPDKMNAVLNVAANVSRHYPHGEVEIVIVAFNAGLHMLRADTSPVKARLESFAQGMPHVAFNACDNTIQSMKQREGKDIPIVPQAKIVPAGVVTLIELAEQGWVIVRP
jgi:intracellular sulfur oxidation DsrE/DsrF family protein